MSNRNSKSLNNEIENNEPLARYVFSENHFKNDRFKRGAFMPPNPSSNFFELSVIRHENCPADCLLKIGKKIKSQRRDESKKDEKFKCIIATISAKDIRKIDKLNVKSDTSNNQHRRHANIINFHSEKAKRKQQAQNLANKAKIIRIENKRN